MIDSIWNRSKLASLEKQKSIIKKPGSIQNCLVQRSLPIHYPLDDQGADSGLSCEPNWNHICFNRPTAQDHPQSALVVHRLVRIQNRPVYITLKLTFLCCYSLTPEYINIYESFPFYTQIAHWRDSLSLHLLREEIYEKRAFNEPCQVRG